MDYWWLFPIFISSMLLVAVVFGVKKDGDNFFKQQSRQTE